MADGRSLHKSSNAHYWLTAAKLELLVRREKWRLKRIVERGKREAEPQSAVDEDATEAAEDGAPAFSLNLAALWADGLFEVIRPRGAPRDLTGRAW